MPRERAGDYDVKIQKILDAAAVLFARTGYPGAKMQDIAKACGASKSMLYHYFPTKDKLLFAMLREHLEDTLFAIEAAITAEAVPQKRFVCFIHTYTQKSAQSRRRHIVAMNDLRFLPKAQQKPILELERKVVMSVADLLRELNPDISVQLYKPYAMLLLGMLNWTDTWYRPGGSITPAELCDRISRLFLKGYLAEGCASSRARP